MTFKTVTASLFALGLFAAVAHAQEAKPEDVPPEAPPPAEAAQDPTQAAPAPAEAAPQQTAAELPAEVLALISDTRSPSEMSPEELQNRFELARRYAREPGISPDIQQQLQQIARAARAELMAREQQQAAPKEEAPKQEAAPADAPPPAPEAPPVKEAAPAPAVPAEPTQQEAAPAPEQAPAQQPEVAEPQQPKTKPAQEQQRSSGESLDNQGGAIPPAVAQMLQDNRPASALDEKQLQRRIARLQQFIAIGDLPPEALQRLQEMQGEAMQEVANRQAGQPPAQTQPPVAEAPPPAPAVDPTQPAAPPPVPPKPPIAEVPVPQPPAAPQPPVAADKRDVQELDANRVNPETEMRAKELMSDEGSIQQLSDEALRRRVEELRAVLATNELSPGLEREIRQQLDMHRTVLRERVAAAEAERLRREQQSQNQRPRNRYWAEEAPSDWEWAVRDVLNDRRRSEDLRTYELRRRLEVLRQAMADRRYDPAYRQYWQAVIARDQYVLSLRLVDLRRKRQAQLDDLYAEEDFTIGEDLPPEDDVFAAEVDDEQLQDVLIARPRKKFNRRFTIEEIEQNDEVRRALPRVEVDTVKFGFNEAFVRPEEIDKLDRIGEILERILKKNPREVFLIEGHTDAVGSDAANLALSRKRAEAVKKALTTYYVIPPRALRTVGYGERYLKIPTAEAEAENRRVSVSRATDLIGQAQ